MFTDSYIQAYSPVSIPIHHLHDAPSFKNIGKEIQNPREKKNVLKMMWDSTINRINNECNKIKTQDC